MQHKLKACQLFQVGWKSYAVCTSRVSVTVLFVLTFTLESPMQLHIARLFVILVGSDISYHIEVQVH